MIKCPENNCGKNLKKALKKIEEDSKLKPNYIIGPTGPKGDQGPTARCNKSSIYIFKW